MAGSLEHIFSAKQLVTCAPQREEALRYLGFTGQDLGETVLANVAKAEACCCESVVPAYAAWRTFPIEECPVALEGDSIQTYVKNAQAITLACVTLGQKSQQELMKAAALGVSYQCILDAYFSSYVQAAEVEAHRIIAEQASEQGLFAALGFSPGYGDFPLSVQPALLDSLNAQRFLGISLTKDYFLVPQKSITVVVGLFDSTAKVVSLNECDACLSRAVCDLRLSGRSCRE